MEVARESTARCRSGRESLKLIAGRRDVLAERQPEEANKKAEVD